MMIAYWIITLVIFVYAAMTFSPGLMQLATWMVVGGIIWFFIWLVRKNSSGGETKAEVEIETEEQIAAREALIEKLITSPDIPRVRGVWESISWKHTSAVIKCTGDRLLARDVHIVDGKLILRSEDKPAWQNALNDPIASEAGIHAQADLDSINSIEMESYASFHTTDAQSEYVRPKLGQSGGLKDRHPHLQFHQGGFYDDTRACSVVYAFTTEGERIRLFQTYSRDLAIRWRTQLDNLIRAAREDNQAVHPTAEHNHDYL